MPQISVIMAVHNGYPYLETAIQSILAQTIRDFEFIIIDDASNDNTPSILNFISKEDSRIRIITNSVQSGLTHSLNIALEHAQGRYIARMDADDISHPDRLKQQSEYLDHHPEITLVGSFAFEIDENSIITGVFKAAGDPDQIRTLMPHQNVIYHPTILFRNLPNIRYREKFVYAQDYDLYLNLLTKNDRLTNLNQYLLKYRITSQALSFRKMASQQLFSLKAQQFFQQRTQSGTDEYERFDPKELLNPSPNESISLLSSIKCSYRFYQLGACRKHCLNYLFHYGLNREIAAYFLKTLLGSTIIRYQRRLKLNSIKDYQF